MRTLTRKQRNQARRILAATRSRIARGGMEGLKLAAIARDVDMTAAALYRYFPNKGALLAAVNAQILRDQTRILIRLEQLTLGDSERKCTLFIQAAMEALINLATEQAESFALLSTTLVDPRILVRDPSQAVHIPELMELRGLLERAILDAQQTQQLSPGDARQRVVRLLFGCLGILQAHKLVRFEPSLDLRAAVRELTMDLLTLWGAKRPALVAGLPNANLLANRALLELL